MFRFLILAAIFAASIGHASETPISESMAKHISKCWNVGSLGSGALAATVDVEFIVEPGGQVKPDSIKLVSGTGSSENANEQLFQSVRRALIRCSSQGHIKGNEDKGRQKVILSFSPKIGITVPSSLPESIET